MTPGAGELPDWITAAFAAPARFADIAAVRGRLVAEPYRVLCRIVPEIDSRAEALGEDDRWKASVVRTLYLAWLEHEPDVRRRTKAAAKAQADRALGVARAAEALLNALASARMGVEACRVDGVEPVLLASGLDELEIATAEQVVRDLLRTARKRSVAPGRHDGYASVATLTSKLDEATAPLGIVLSEAAAADFFELADLSAKRIYTEEAIRKSRARTVRD